jgi:hypothetical protein
MLNNFNHMSLETFLYSNDPNSSGGKMLCLVLLSVKHANEKSDMALTVRPGVSNYKKQKIAANYQRMLIFGDPTCPNLCCAIFESRDGMTEKLLWQESLPVRSHLKVGDWFAILEPEPITHTCKGNIQKMDTTWPLIPINRPTLLVHFNPPRVVGHQESFFIHTNNLRIDRAVVLENCCGGTFCDRQKPTIDRCGCYSQSAVGGNCVMRVVVGVQAQGNAITADFSSWAFTQMPFEIGTAVAALSPRDIRLNIIRVRQGFNDLVQFVNERSGWGIIGWYRLSEVKDGKEDTGSTNMSETVQYHPVSIYVSDPHDLEEFKSSPGAIRPSLFT